MNPMTNIKNLQKLNERELELGIIGKKSWHDEYRDSAWIFTGGLPYDLTEGDIICVFSQYGEIVNINLVRDSKTGKSKGYAFICFQDQRSTVLTVDNLNGSKILGRTIRVDHVKDYKMPKEHGDEDEATLKLRQEGCAPRIESSPEPVQEEEGQEKTEKSQKKRKKEKKMKKEKKKKKKRKVSESSVDEDSDSKESDEDNEAKHVVKKENLDIKDEKIDRGYDKALGQSNSTRTSNFDDYKQIERVKKESKWEENESDSGRRYKASRDADRETDFRDGRDQGRRHYKDRKNYNRDGEDRKNYNRDGEDRKNYNRDGEDRKNYNRDGEDRKNYNRDGEDRKNYNRDGEDRKNYNRDGEDRKNYNRDGEDRKNYNRDGEDRKNYNRDGEDRKNYNRDGEDRKNHNRDYDRDNQSEGNSRGGRYDDDRDGRRQDNYHGRHEARDKDRYYNHKSKRRHRSRSGSKDR